jgi:ABC-type enterochelin transport system ATPase subunit
MVENKDFCTFISSIGHCLSLEQFEINLQGNFLSETSGTALAKALSYLKELRKISIYLEDNKIG